MLFGATPEETRTRAADIGKAGFRAAKFGWAPFGDSLANDVLHIEAAREGLGREGVLLIDAGQIFGEDVEAAALRLDANGLLRQMADLHLGGRRSLQRRVGFGSPLVGC